MLDHKIRRPPSNDRDHIKSHIDIFQALELQEAFGHLPDRILLLLMNRFERITVKIVLPRLDLNKAYASVPGRHNVDLPKRQFEIPFQDPVTLPAKMLNGSVLPGSPQALSMITHGSF